jgi:hypothetical protein
MSILRFLLMLGLPAKLHDKFQPITGIAKLLPGNIGGGYDAIQEISVINDGPGNLKIYFTQQLSNSNNVIGMATAAHMEDTWAVQSQPVVGMGYGGAPSNRQANCSFIFKADGYYYCIATNGYGFGSPGEDQNVYLYRSTDGITFTDLGKLLDKSLILGASGFGNCSIYPALVNGKYEILAEARIGGIWQISRLSSTAIESGWTFINTLQGLQVISGGMYGGPQHFYFDSLWYIFYHYGSEPGNLPTLLGRAISSDLVTVLKKETPMFGIEATPYGSSTDQIADPFIVEADGKTYLVAEYCQNAGSYAAQIWMWSFSGTLTHLLANT